MTHTVRIIAIDNVTHDVKRIVAEKPEGYTFEPGQATEVAINKEDFKDEKRPFTFTSLPEDEHLELIVKMYEREGVTQKFDQLNTDDELIIGDAWGSIRYKGPGYFIAGGAGVTPFIAILRKLEKDGKMEGNTLLYSNKEERDIILEVELRQMLGLKFVNTLTQEKNEQYFHGRIDKKFLQDHVKDFSKYFYVCGTMEMTEEVLKNLKELGVKEEQLVYEQ
ncbi:MAG TPA: FAD-binding oxidoreductase [Salinivirga sp.]|uniref:FAD-binding oxidoreductase n=1 Tax=Salinivirga sp. TaxID=1970192 RepID=UPI002B4856A4|nr:FAD-binding oxidoreductase [Salinivirga sp.]HKK60518.1 FAD-binding oxidoreductase [Salinivirga sp.]